MISEDNLDLFFFGELNHRGSPECNLPQDRRIDFKEPNGYFQLILTERVVNCALQALVQSKTATMNLQGYKIESVLEQSNIDIDVGVISQFVESVEELYN